MTLFHITEVWFSSSQSENIHYFSTKCILHFMFLGSLYMLEKMTSTLIFQQLSWWTCTEFYRKCFWSLLRCWRVFLFFPLSSTVDYIVVKYYWTKSHSCCNTTWQRGTGFPLYLVKILIGIFKFLIVKVTLLMCFLSASIYMHSYVNMHIGACLYICVFVYIYKIHITGELKNG